MVGGDPGQPHPQRHRRRGEHLAGLHRRGARGARRPRPRRPVRAGRAPVPDADPVHRDVRARPPRAAVLPEGLRRRPGAPVAALPRHRHLSRARRDASPPTAGRPRCSTAPTRCPGPASCSSRSPPCRSRRSTCSARRAPPTSGPPRCPYVPGVQAVGVVRDGPAGARRPAGVVPHHGRDGARRRRAGRARGRGRRRGRRRSRPTCPTPSVAALGLSAVAAWEVLEGRAALRPGETGARARRRRGRRPGRACRRRACSAPAESSRRPARTHAQRAGRRPAVRMPWSTCAPTTTPRRWPERLREACGGHVDVVVDPLAGVPGHGRGAGARATAVAWSTSAAAPALPLTVDSAALRSRSAAVLGYTNNALTDAPPAGGVRARSSPTRPAGGSRWPTTSSRSTRRRPPGPPSPRDAPPHRVVVTP